MGRVGRLGIAVMAAIVLLGASSCSSKDDLTAVYVPPDTGSGQAPSDPGAPAGDETPTDETVVTEPSPSGPEGEAAPPVAAEAVGGWRLVVTYPTAGATVGRTALLCYVVTGPNAQAGIALDLTVGSRAPIRVAGSAGFGSSRVNLGEADTEPQDIRVQLIVDGKRLDGGVATVPSVLIVPAVADPTCP